MLLPSVVSLQQLLFIGSGGVLYNGVKLTENGEERRERESNIHSGQ